VPIIKPKGLLGGDRMAELSDEARLYWPFLYAASNGHGRFVIDYVKILQAAFRHFLNKPSEEFLGQLLAQYRDCHLLFVYEAPDGTVWGAWDSASGQQYFTEEDKRSPAPPEREFQAWLARYRVSKGCGQTAKTSLGTSLLSGVLRKQADFIKIPGSFHTKIGTSHTTQHNTENTTQHVSLTQTQTQAPADENADRDPERWRALLFAANTVGMIYAEGQLPDLRERWRSYAIDERKAAIAGIEIRIQTGEYADAHFVPTLKKYLHEKLWTARLRPGPPLVQRKKPEVDTSFLDEIIERGKKARDGAS